MKYRWSIQPQQPARAAKLSAALGRTPLLAQCLLNRGLTELEQVKSFLEPRLKQLADPFLIPNMQAAVDRLFAALEKQEPLVVFGDYDVDGVTSTALLLEALRALGWQVNHYLPHRMDEGYGLTREAAENCLKKFPVTLVLAVDCGSSAVETIAWLAGQGIDVLVLDHHQITDPPPAACALVNPLFGANRFAGETHGATDSASPPASTAPRFSELCSAGLAFKLAHALAKRGRELNLPAALTFDLKPFLDLVALGTIADLVPLTGENRILVTMGLERLNDTRRHGLLELMRVAEVKRPVGVYEVGFQLGPRLNAAGRLENAAEALDLILATDAASARPLAVKLDARNRERQKIEKSIVDEVLGAVRARFNPESDYVIVEGQLLWHVGVVGIVASRVLQQFYRPTIIVGGEGGQWRGSGRSIAGFDLAAALRECDDLLVRHGGHAMAAGLTIDPERLAAFRTRLNDFARRTLSAELLQPILRLDAEVKLTQISLPCLAELDRLNPIGQGNPSIQFVARNLTLTCPPRRMGADKQHVKLSVSDGLVTLEAVWWRVGPEAQMPVHRFDLCFVPQVNDFNGTRSVQLKVLDWQPAA